MNSNKFVKEKEGHYRGRKFTLLLKDTDFEGIPTETIEIHKGLVYDEDKIEGVKDVKVIREEKIFEKLKSLLESEPSE